MDYIDQIKKIANHLDRQGFFKQADLLDKYLYTVGQLAEPLTPEEPAPAEAEPSPEEAPMDDPMADLGGMAPPAEEDPNRDTKEKISRTTFLMLSELRDFFAKNLQDFKYFGEDNVKTIQAAFDQLVTMYRVLLRNVSKEYNQEAVHTYEQYLKNLQKEVDRSKKMRLTPVKVKIDKFLLYNEFEIMLRKIERHYDDGLKELQPVLKKARSVRDAFANIIQQTSEEVAHADLIETS